MNDKQILDWLEQCKVSIRYMPAVQFGTKQILGGWEIDFGLHSFSAPTLRECVKLADSEMHLIPVC